MSHPSLSSSPKVAQCPLVQKPTRPLPPGLATSTYSTLTRTTFFSPAVALSLALFLPLTVSNLTETYSLDVEKALISNLLSTENEIPPQNEDLQNFDHLKIFEVNDLENKSIGVLLDAKYAHSFCTQTPIIGNSDEPIGLITKFGLA